MRPKDVAFESGSDKVGITLLFRFQFNTRLGAKPQTVL